MPRRRPLVALAAALALAACSDATGPVAELAGERYALRSVDGQPLPFLLAGTPTGARQELVAETLEFRALGRLRRTRTLRSTDAAGAVETVTLRRDTYYRPSEAGEVSAPGVVLRVGSIIECGPPLPNALSVACDPVDRAVASGGVVTLTSPFFGAMSVTALTLRFERTSPDPVVVPVGGVRR